MVSKKVKWLIYTVAVGLIPIVIRIFIWLLTNQSNMNPISTSDIIAFGLVLHISNINEIEHIRDEQSQSWKTVQNGISILFIAVYSVFLSVIIIAEANPQIINGELIRNYSAGLSVISFIISFSIFHRISKMNH